MSYADIELLSQKIAQKLMYVSGINQNGVLLIAELADGQQAAPLTLYDATMIIHSELVYILED